LGFAGLVDEIVDDLDVILSQLAGVVLPRALVAPSAGSRRFTVDFLAGSHGFIGQRVSGGNASRK
jgi:hypothetical protein